MSKPIRYVLLGCGTVGSGILEIVEQSRSLLESRIGAPLDLAKVVVRNPDRARNVALPAELVGTDPVAAVEDPTVDVVVEVMGGLEPAGTAIERALRAGKSVVTANKSLLAARGSELLALAAERRVDLAFEASVGGAIPVVRTLRDHLPHDHVTSLRGIVNGTCNYILTKMRDEGASFTDVLKEAQQLGYAEAEPSLDVDGHDAAHKLCVLAQLAFGVAVPPSEVPTEGIRAIEPIDHRFAARFGYTIKHLAVARQVDQGVELRVHPALVPSRAPLASVDSVLNAIALDAQRAGTMVLVGRGAGSLPTAVSVVADMVDVARARRAGVPGLWLDGRLPRPQSRAASSGAQEREALWYLRVRAADRPGVLAKIAGALGQNDVSIEQLVQEGGGRRVTDPTPDAGDETRVIVMLTHHATESEIRAALRTIDSSGFTLMPSLALRVEA